MVLDRRDVTNLSFHGDFSTYHQEYENDDVNLISSNGSFPNWVHQSHVHACRGRSAFFECATVRGNRAWWDANRRQRSFRF